MGFIGERLKGALKPRAAQGGRIAWARSCSATILWLLRIHSGDQSPRFIYPCNYIASQPSKLLGIIVRRTGWPRWTYARWL